MATATFKILYRPVKIGFLIDEKSIDDLIRAVGINTMLWGGMYNPIIPVAEEKKYTKELFQNFRVDVLYDLSKSNQTSDFIKNFPYLRPPIGSTEEIFLAYRNQLAYRDVGNHLMDSLISEKVKGAAYYRFTDSYKYSALLRIILGFYPKMEGSDYDFLKGFIERLNPTIREITEETNSYGIFHNAITPIKFTSIDISQYGSLKAHFHLQHSNNGIFIGSGNNFDDLVYYWNLRAYGFDLNFYSIDEEKLFEENIADFIKKFDKPESEMKYGPEACIFFRNDNERFFDIVRSKMQADPFYTPLHNSYLGILTYDNPFGFFRSGTFDALAHINEPQSGGYQISLSLPNIPLHEIETRETSNQIFVASVDPETEPFYKYTLNVPYIQDLHEFYSRKIVGSIKPFELRCQSNGIGVLVNNEKRTLSIQPILFRELIFELFKLAGLEPQQSQAGLLTIKIINKLGHLDSCRVFKIRGVRKVFRSLEVEDTISRSKIERDIYDEGRFSKYHRLYIERRSTQDLTTRSVVDFLFRHDFFRAGLELPCNSCNLENWLPLKRLDDFWVCEFCGYKNQLNVALKDRGDWKFRKSGLFGKNNNQEGAIPVILTLMQLYGRLQGTASKHTMIYEAATKFIKPRDCEIDFSVINLNDQSDFEIGFGECKDEGGNIDTNDLENLKFVYEKCKKMRYKPYIILSKTADRFNEDEINIFKKAKLDGFRLILFTNTDLESYGFYDPYRGKLNLPREYPSSLRDLHWNSDYIYLRDIEGTAGTLY